MSEIPDFTAVALRGVHAEPVESATARRVLAAAEATPLPVDGSTPARSLGVGERPLAV